MNINTQIFAVTGDPVLHSRSPGMFNKVFGKSNINAAYLRLAAKDPSEAVSVFRSLGMKGMNVTAPFKESILEYLDEIHKEAEILGCVNTIVDKNGILHGYNTDPYGVIQSFKDSGISLKGKNCLVIGAGGAGKAAAYGLMKENAIVTMINRTNSTAEKAAKRVGCSSKSYDELEEYVRNSEIIISSLSQKINLVKKEWLNSSQIVLDANYKNSDLNLIAFEKGCKIISAENWLLNQAIRSYELFLNEKPDIEFMKVGLKSQYLSDRKNKISLVGLTGAGKTSIGKVLSEKLKCDIKDIDESVSQAEKMSITKIFKMHGEAYFRKLESKELSKSLCEKNHMVISCGGGIVKSELNRKQLKEKSLVVWLYVTPETIHSRLDISDRPFLQADDPLKRLNELFNERKGMYAETAHIIFSNEYVKKEIISDKIIKELKSL